MTEKQITVIMKMIIEDLDLAPTTLTEDSVDNILDNLAKYVYLALAKINKENKEKILDELAGLYGISEDDANKII